jgi:UDP-galactopyranose mutase
MLVLPNDVVIATPDHNKWYDLAQQNHIPARYRSNYLLPLGFPKDTTDLCNRYNCKAATLHALHFQGNLAKFRYSYMSCRQ